MNKILVIGHLGRDPELRYTPNGQAGILPDAKWQHHEFWR